MSFGPSQATKNAENTLNGQSQIATQNSSNLNAAGTGQMNAGAGNVNSGVGFLNTVLNGNQANTASLLAPSINSTRQSNQAALQGISTLMPRGGGRYGALFGQSLQPTQSIQNMFNGARTTAATTLPQIGLQQQGLGANLFNTGNSALNTGVGATGQNLQATQADTRNSNALATGIGSSIMGLALAPVSGLNGGSLFGNLIKNV